MTKTCTCTGYAGRSEGAADRHVESTSEVLLRILSAELGRLTLRVPFRLLTSLRGRTSVRRNELAKRRCELGSDENAPIAPMRCAFNGHHLQRGPCRLERPDACHCRIRRSDDRERGHLHGRHLRIRDNSLTTSPRQRRVRKRIVFLDDPL